MKFPCYHEYKDSGVAWLGAVPVHWKITPLKRITALIESGVSVNAADEPAADGEIGVLKTSCVYGGAFQPTENKVVIHDDLGRVACSVKANTLIVSRMNTPALVGAAGIVNQNASNLFLPDRLWQVHFKDAKPTFVHYWTQTTSYRTQVEASCEGTSSSMKNLSQTEFLGFLLAIPSDSEQTAIAAFLDRETGKIDALIAEQERLVALLKEKRQALISRAVTKGLDPSAPMKDSGIEWLGDVPTHWEVKQIKRLTIVQRGASPRPIDDPKYFDDEGRYAWVRIADVSASDGHLRETTQRLSELGSSLSVRLAPGSLFISIAGTVGKPCITDIEACIHDGFVYFPTLNLDPMFLYRVFEAGGCYGGLGKFGTQLNLNTDTIGSICVAVPPPRELVAVLAHLDQTTAAIDSLTREAVHAVDLLKDRRNALISAAVTGKIDVRDASWSLNEVRRAIKWGAPRQPAPDWDCEPDAVIWVSVSKLDAAWEAAGEDYIGHGGIGASIDGRYERFGAWLRKNSGPVELPVVAMDDGNKLGFVDGRHRFAWLRDHGVRAMPVQVEVAQQQIFESQFGSTERESIISEQGYLV